MRYCPNCKHENEDDAIFCVICGMELPDVKSMQQDEKTTALSDKKTSKKSVGITVCLLALCVVFIGAVCLKWVGWNNDRKVTENKIVDIQDSATIKKQSEESKEQNSVIIEKQNQESNTQNSSMIEATNGEIETSARGILYLSDIVDLTNSDIVAYKVARDAQGNYYDYALGGKNIDVENYCTFSIEIISDEYRYFQGSVIKNFDYKSASDYDNSVKIFFDGACVYEAQPQLDNKTADFHLDITGVNQISIVMEGANYLRLVDTAFTNEDEMISTANISSNMPKSIGEVLGKDESNIRTYISVRDNEGNVFYQVLAGTKSDVVNEETYELNKKYTEFSGKVLLNYDYKDIENSDVYVEIYVDYQLRYKSPLIMKGMKTESFSVDLRDAEVMTIKIGGRNYARIADANLV